MNLQRLCNVVALGLGLAACSTQAHPQSPANLPLAQADARPLPPGTVAARPAPYSALGASGLVPPQALEEVLSQQHVVCLGEQHDNLTHHALQLALTRALVERASQSGNPIAVGFEMFSLEDQSALDDYAIGAIAEAEFLQRTRYDQHWGYDFEYYRSLLEWSRGLGAKLLALNAPKTWTKAVARQGASGLQTVDASLQPKDLVLDDPQHQRFFQAAMADHAPVHGHSAHAGNSDNLAQNPIYAAQVVWDETMARTAARWLAATGTHGRVIIIAGAGHCHRSAIPRRMERRLPGVRTKGVRLLTRSDMALQIQHAHTPVPANSEYELLVIAEQ